MKRLSLLLVSIFMICCFSGCSGGDNGDKKADAPAVNTENMVQPTTDQSQSPSDPAQPAAAEPAQPAQPAPADPQPAQ